MNSVLARLPASTRPLARAAPLLAAQVASSSRLSHISPSLNIRPAVSFSSQYTRVAAASCSQFSAAQREQRHQSILAISSSSSSSSSSLRSFSTNIRPEDAANSSINPSILASIDPKTGATRPISESVKEHMYQSSTSSSSASPASPAHPASSSPSQSSSAPSSNSSSDSSSSSSSSAAPPPPQESAAIPSDEPPSMAVRLTKIADKSGEFIRTLPSKIVSLSVSLARSTWSVSQAIYRDPKIVGEWYRSTKITIKEHVDHFVAGSKLLAADIRFATKLVGRVVEGRTLTRRERTQLQRTVGDIFRLVPFAVIIIVPFAEFALPVLLKIFPNMLPSTFDDKHKKQELMKKELKAKVELAKFLTDTCENMATRLQASSNNGDNKDAKQLEAFVARVRNGEPVSNDEILRFSKLFSDEITLDNISRPQLVAMCKYMGIAPYGGDSILRFNLRNKLRQLKADDRLIYWEGANALNTEELAAACAARGMRSTGISDKAMRRNLQQWLELSLNRSIPSSLLIMSRAFLLSDKSFKNPEEALGAALSTLPDDVVQEVSLEKAESSSVATSSKEKTELYEKKLESLKRVEERIAKEKEERPPQAASSESKKPEASSAAASAASSSSAAQQQEQHHELSDEHLTQITEAVTAMAEPSFVAAEREDIQDIKADLVRSRSASSAAAAASGTSSDESSSKAHSKLSSRLSGLLHKLEKEAAKIDATVGSNLQVIDLDNDGKISRDELMSALHNLKTRPSEAALEKIMKHFDKDNDGVISLQELEILLEHMEELAEQDVAPQMVVTPTPAAPAQQPSAASPPS